jgi:hypothetical protein
MSDKKRTVSLANDIEKHATLSDTGGGWLTDEAW